MCNQLDLPDQKISARQRGLATRARQGTRPEDLRATDLGLIGNARLYHSWNGPE